MTNVINVNCGAPSVVLDFGTLFTREYASGTELSDRRGRFWLVTTYRTTAYPTGTPPFEAWDLARVWDRFGPLVVTDGGMHKRIHTRPQPGCDNCPPRDCWCGRSWCTDYDTCRRNEAGSETSWRIAA